MLAGLSRLVVAFPAGQVSFMFGSRRRSTWRCQGVRRLRACSSCGYAIGGSKRTTRVRGCDNPSANTPNQALHLTAGSSALFRFTCFTVGGWCPGGR